MAESRPDEREFRPPAASRQIAFHQLLTAARKVWLEDALSEALGVVDPAALREQLVRFAPREALQALAVAGVRDEQVFPVPILLDSKPTLVGYYRLLLGASQKSFYASTTGLSLFKSMETRGSRTKRQLDELPRFCRAMCRELASLVLQLSPRVTPRDISELKLLTLGSQFQGGNNNAIGRQATTDVFLTITEIVRPYIVDQTDQRLVLRNASNRAVIISLASDPDVRIQEDFGGTAMRNKVAIEIKGGTDRSNAHNRAGEAEKSHQKARAEDFRDCWTIIAMKGLDQAKLRQESPSTNSWFDVAQVLGQTGPSFEEFRSRLADTAGIPLRADTSKPRGIE